MTDKRFLSIQKRSHEMALGKLVNFTYACTKRYIHIYMCVCVCFSLCVRVCICMCGCVCVCVIVCSIKLKHKNLMIYLKFKITKEITLPTKPYIGSIRNIHIETRNNSTKSHNLILGIIWNPKDQINGIQRKPKKKIEGQ